MLSTDFFCRDALVLAQALLGKVIKVGYKNRWLAAQVIETEAYFLNEKGSHASLGLTEKRKALFMPAGTIYMYYARGGDSLNVSAQGEGNAVLIKSGIPYVDKHSPPEQLAVMQRLNPRKNSQQPRPFERLCAGQTLLCKSLGLQVKVWDQQNFCRDKFYLTDVGYVPQEVIQARRLGIPKGRDEHLLYRFIDARYLDSCTENPLRKRSWREGYEYIVN